MQRLVQIAANAVALWVTALIVPGIDFDPPPGEWWKILVVALAFGLLNTFLRPILQILTLPITFMTLGLFLLVINALMLMLTSAISAELALGFAVADFWAALLGAIVVAVVGLILSLFLGSARRLLA
jgi:putative membrane protein